MLSFIPQAAKLSPREGNELQKYLMYQMNERMRDQKQLKESSVNQSIQDKVLSSINNDMNLSQEDLLGYPENSKYYRPGEVDGTTPQNLRPLRPKVDLINNPIIEIQSQPSFQSRRGAA